MAFKLVAKDGQSKELNGLLVLLPFAFGDQSRLKLLPDKSSVVAHYRLSPSMDTNFPKSTRGFAGAREWTIDDVNGQSILTLTDYEAIRVWSTQTLGIGDSMLYLKGRPSETTKMELDASLPATDFELHNATTEDGEYTWGGKIQDSKNARILTVSYANVVLSMSNSSLLSCGFGGPLKSAGEESIFQWLLSHGEWMNRSADSAPVHVVGNALPALTFECERRNTKLDLFGDESKGVGRAQVRDAQGFVFLVQGTFAREIGLTELERCGRGVHTEDFDTIWRELSSVLKYQNFFSAYSNQKADSLNTDDIMHEGIALWGLRRRYTEDAHEPALPPLL